ncbi:MAG: 4a-hydroxytetrahydrobiopterin dehydratase [Cellvibrionaceae bacterium]|nr:4a-hydroxytetrahydrobiopterin dehydratase [Cellvibrionaceae bacterium]
MKNLHESQCEACLKDAPTLNEVELSKLQPEIPAWVVVESESVKQLIREYAFLNFASALAFANVVGELAEQQGHHPAITVEWGRATVSWWTHEIGGLHKNDVIMAAKTDVLFREFSS